MEFDLQDADDSGRTSGPLFNLEPSHFVRHTAWKIWTYWTLMLRIMLTISRDAFTSFYPMIARGFYSYGRGGSFLMVEEVLERDFFSSNITFTNLLYVPTLVNNNPLQCRRS